MTQIEQKTHKSNPQGLKVLNWILPQVLKNYKNLRFNSIWGVRYQVVVCDLYQNIYKMSTKRVWITTRQNLVSICGYCSTQGLFIRTLDWILSLVACASSHIHCKVNEKLLFTVESSTRWSCYLLNEGTVEKESWCSAWFVVWTTL